MNRRAFLAALAAAPAAALAPGCGGGAAPGARTLRFAYPTDYKSLDPAQCFDAATMQLMRLLYGGLLDCDDDMRLVPWLAAGLPEVSADKKKYTFTVRKGVRFANGRELTADDFVYAVERVLDPATKSPAETLLRNVRGARAFKAAREADAGRGGLGPGERVAEPTRLEGARADGDTLRFELERPDLAFPWLATMPCTYPLPREEVERHGEEFYRNPCGTGPFVLAEWRRDLRVRFERNPHYAGRAGAGLDAIEILIGYDFMTQTMMFERGELDLLNVPPADFVRLTRDPRWRPRLRTLMLQETDFLVMNCEMEPFTDRRVRRAVCLAVDRERAMRAVNGMGVPAKCLVPPGVFGHDPGRTGYPYDPDGARRLLAEAGYPEGFAVDLWYPTDVPVWAKIVEVIQQDLKKVKIDASLKQVAYEVFNDATGRRRNVAFSFFGWTENYPDAGDFLNNLCDGARIVDDQCTNMAFYDDPDVNEWLHAAAVSTDENERLALYRKAEDRILDDAPYCVVYHEKANYLCRPRVANCTLHPLWYIRYEDIALEAP
jgi:ABC-type transport system substrate-binding protein